MSREPQVVIDIEKFSNTTAALTVGTLLLKWGPKA